MLNPLVISGLLDDGLTCTGNATAGTPCGLVAKDGALRVPQPCTKTGGGACTFYATGCETLGWTNS